MSTFSNILKGLARAIQRAPVTEQQRAGASVSLVDVIAKEDTLGALAVATTLLEDVIERPLPAAELKAVRQELEILEGRNIELERRAQALDAGHVRLESEVARLEKELAAARTALSSETAELTAARHALSFKTTEAATLHAINDKILEANTTLLKRLCCWTVYQLVWANGRLLFEVRVNYDDVEQAKIEWGPRLWEDDDSIYGVILVHGIPPPRGTDLLTELAGDGFLIMNPNQYEDGVPVWISIRRAFAGAKESGPVCVATELAPGLLREAHGPLEVSVIA